MFDEVKTDKTRALFEDYPVLLYGIAGQRVRDGDLEEDPTGYGFAVDEGQNPELLEKFNTGLSNFTASGEYDKIVSAYLGEEATTDDNSYLGLIDSTWKVSLQGLKMTVILTLFSIFFALIVGIVGLFRVSRSMWLRAIGTTFVDIFRGTPLLVQAFLSTSASRRPSGSRCRH